MASETSHPLPRVGRLDRISDVRTELGRLYRSARRNEMSAPDAARLASILSILLRAIEGSDFEQRLEKLEKDASLQQTNGHALRGLHR